MTNSVTKIIKNWVSYDIYSVEWGSTIQVDSELSDTSENPVQNKVVKAAIDWKQGTLTAWSNITINNGEISATDTTYTASSFDIKDLSDTTSLRETWSWKQDALVSWTNIKTVNNQSLVGTWNVSVWTLTAETVVSGVSGTTYTIKVANSEPTAWTPATTITFVL